MIANKWCWLSNSFYEQHDIAPERGTGEKTPKEENNFIWHLSQVPGMFYFVSLISTVHIIGRLQVGWTYTANFSSGGGQ